MRHTISGILLLFLPTLLCANWPSSAQFKAVKVAEALGSAIYAQDHAVVSASDALSAGPCGHRDRRTIRHPGYEVSQRKRKLVEQIFGWLKTVGLMRKTRHRGERRVGWMFVFTLAVHNLVRLRNLQAASG